ncbi:glycosyltransferase family 2 protein [Phenylobacterium sp.]|uniref:glycosyltransferase family 2 protein n=1 Tax=Phenylobacterium sp. TaxID=1871053 RepID=UPI0035B1B0F2
MPAATPQKRPKEGRRSPRAPAALSEAEVLRRKLEGAERQIAALRTEIAILQEVRREQALRIEEIMRSTSWRLTRPLRAIMLLLRGQITVRDVLERLGLKARSPRPQPAVWAPEPAPPPAVAPLSAAPPPKLKPLAFPLAGNLAWLPELTGEALDPIDVTVSVIIPTWNAGAEFYWLLRKLRAQRGLAGVEIVVVDSGSTDGTPEMAEAHGCTVVRIPNSEFSHSYARNLGADNATGDLYLFTVQDAYPVSDNWLYALARALLQPAKEEERVSALSCTEFPRRDSELLYNAGVDTHYAFLGCRDSDRVGEMIERDHMSLRSQGQLSDVACLIPAETFQSYRYEGRYAEDLILGVRMIREGHRLAMVSSAKIIHSHNRPARYHLKRTFVDVLFLTDVFPDFGRPIVESVRGIVAAAGALYALFETWTPAPGAPAGETLAEFARRARRLSVDTAAPSYVDFGFEPLGPWLRAAVAADTATARWDAELMRNMFADRIEGVAVFAGRVYGPVDDALAAELRAAVEKTLASTLGALLAYLYAGQPESRRTDEMRALYDFMLAGV